MSGTPEKSKADFSDLLAELAGEATAKSRALQNEEVERQARDAALHGALSKLFKFFNQFSNHLNQIKPTIPRVYGSPLQIVYDKLVWNEGFTDFRKQSFADNALLDHVTLRIQLHNATPVQIKRRWHQLDDLKNDLSILGLCSLDDLDIALSDKTKQEFFHLHLAPDFYVRLHFQGNYATGNIELLCTNLDDFGTFSCTLPSAAITTQLLDELGRYLMARHNDLPELLQHNRHPAQRAFPS
jgi:hypothetical protein